MTTNENHTQAVVVNFVGEGGIAGSLLLEKDGDLRFLVPKRLFPAGLVQSQVSRYAHDPGRRILRNSIVGPCLQGLDESLLDDILRKLKTLEPKNSRQGRDHLSPFAPEEMLHHLRHVRGWWQRFVAGLRHWRLRVRSQLPARLASPRTPQPQAGLPPSLHTRGRGIACRWRPPHRDRPR